MRQRSAAQAPTALRGCGLRAARRCDLGVLSRVGRMPCELQRACQEANLAWVLVILLVSLQIVHLRRFAMATVMMGVVAGSGLVCMHSSSDTKEMADRKCALVFEDKKVCASCTQKTDTNSDSLDFGGRSATGYPQQ